MKLKHVVASMSLLGLVSCPVLAATPNQTDANATVMTSKQKYHQVKHYRMKKAVAMRDFKDEVIAIKPAPVAVCTINESTILLTGMTQNVGRSLPNPCNPGWFNRISISGGLNFDIGKWGNRNADLMGENYQRLSLNDAYLNISAVINDWTKAFASISYNTATINDPLAAFAGTDNLVTEYSAAYSNNALSGGNNTLQIEQAYATIGNFEVSPLFLQVGKQFQDFSRYEIHPITRSLTQVMSETLATSIKLGFIAQGFHGSIYAFDDPLPKVGQSAKTTNYGAALGVDMPSNEIGWDLGIAYLYNLIGANDVAYRVNQFNIAATAAPTIVATGVGYNNRVSGGALYGDLYSGPFTLGLRYTTALQRFNSIDLPRYGVAPSTTGAKPWALGLQAGFGFDYWMCKPQNIYLGWQTSREASGLGLPKNRYLLGYEVEFWKATSFGLEWDHDNAYNVANGGSGNNTNLVSLRAAVEFN